MRSLTRIIGIVTVGVAAVLTGASATGAATTGAVSPPAAAPAAVDVQPSIVEDYSYPGADQILKDRGLNLISGDGHLMLVACGSTGLIEVRASNPSDPSSDPGHYCFTVTGPTGYLKLNLPNAYQVKGDNHAVQATITVKGATTTVPINKNSWTGIGLGSGGQDPATLLELKAAP
jgi:hypothetical protein